METLTKIGDWYRGPIKKWETDLYGYELESGYGDLISNNTAKIKREQIRTAWAHECIERCFDLLKLRQRWTDEINHQIPFDRQCNSRFTSWLSKMKGKLAGKLDITIQRKYRWQGDMTRDPYINAIACAVDMGLMDFIHTVSIPWYLWRPTTWKWHKYLKEPTEKNFRRWERAERISAMFDQKDFVHELKRHRREAAVKVYNNSL